MKIKLQKVLLFNVAGDKLAGLAVILTSMGTTFEIVDISRQGETISSLLGISSGANKAGESFDDEMLVMYGFRDAQINTLLKRMRESGIRIALKAVATANNLGWSAAELRNELKKEHEALIGSNN